MSTLRTYQMTIASTWYDKRKGAAQEYEMHFKTARAGDITRVRRQLAERGLEYFQRNVYRLTGRWIPKRRIKVKFEQEQPATKRDLTIRIESRRMEYRGREWKAFALPSRLISYVKKKYRSWRHKHPKG